MKEKAFIALSWIPKATVQAALASVPADLIASYKPGDAEYAEWGQAHPLAPCPSLVSTPGPTGGCTPEARGPSFFMARGTRTSIRKDVG